MAVVWARLGRDSNMQPAVRLAIAGGIAFVLLALTIATRSRAGAVLSVAALILASLLMLGKREPLFVERKGAVQSPLIKWFVFAPFAAISVALAGLAFSKAESVERLFATNLAEEQRGQMLDPLFAMIKAFMPFGSGFGSFDSLYRGFEPNELLLPTYMNHAHNDLLQLMIEGGLPGALLLLVVIYWWVRRSMFVWARVDRLAATQLLGRLGSSIVVLILLASLVDYPLRTPLIACLFALGAWWLEMAARGTTITRPEPQAR
jgi:O-antigen ligase